MTATVQPLPSPAKRMALKNVVKGRLDAPLKTVLFGPEGIGKSTFGAGAPSPIFLAAEEGTNHLDVARFPQPGTFADVLEAIAQLTMEAHDYQTLVIDTLDWIEPLVWRQTCARDPNKPSNIEEVGGGFQKGYLAAVDDWRLILSALERLREAKRMGIVLLSHSGKRTFKNPEGPDFDRYEMKIHPLAAGVWREWSDTVLYAQWEQSAVKKDRDKAGMFAKGKGVSTGARIVWTQRTAAYDAKNRSNLPQMLPLSWADYMAAVKANTPASADDLIAVCRAKAEELGDDVPKTVAGSLAKAGRDTQMLLQLNNWLNAKLAATAEKESEAK